MLSIRLRDKQIVNVVNWDFSYNLSYWNSGNTSYWSQNYRIFGKSAYHNTGSTTSLYQTLDITNGEIYEVTYTIGSYTSGSINVSIGSNSGTTRNTEGEFTDVIIANGTTLYINPSSDFKGSITNVIIKTNLYYEYTLSPPENNEVNLNFFLQDVYDITKRGSSYSLSFELPGDKINDRIFQYLYRLDINSEAKDIFIKKLIDCEISYNTLPIATGTLQLNSINLGEGDQHIFITTFLGQYNSFADKMGDNLIFGNDVTSNDIDISELNHHLTFNNIEYSYLNDLDYKYGLVDYTEPNSNIFYVDDMRPQVKARYLWDKIHTKYGFTYTGDTSQIDNLVLPFMETSLDNATINQRSFEVSLSTDQTYGGVGAPQSNTNLPVGNYVKILFDNNINDPDGVISSSNFNVKHNGVYKFKLNLKYNLKIEAFDQGLSPLNLIVAPFAANIVKGPVVYMISEYWLFRDGNYTCLHSQKEVLTQYGQFYNIKYSPQSYIQHEYTSEELNFGDVVFVRCRLDQSDCRWIIVGSGNDVPITRIQSQIYSSNSMFKEELVSSNIREGDYLYMRYMFGLKPTYKQIDFITDIIKMFNYVVETDKENDKNLIYYTHDTYFSLGSNEDWTEKFHDINKKIERLDTWDKNIYLTYTDDTDYYNNLYNNTKIFGEKLVENEIKTSNKITIQPTLAPTPMDTYGSSGLIVPKIYKRNDDGTTEQLTFKPRIFIYNPILMDTQNYIIRSNEYDYHFSYSGTTNYRKYFYYVGHFDNPYTPTRDINFGECTYYFQPLTTNTTNNLYNTYYRKYITQLLDLNSKLYNCYLELTSEDIFSLKFNNRIQIGSDFFYLNKVINWNPDTLTQVELLKFEEYVDYLTDTPIHEPFVKIKPISKKKNYINQQKNIGNQSIIVDASGVTIETVLIRDLEGYPATYFVENTNLGSSTSNNIITGEYNNFTNSENGNITGDFNYIGPNRSGILIFGNRNIIE